jgi:hypothetical protein
MLNFASFVAGSIYLGGDALNGCIKDGHYYIYGNHLTGPKVRKEVSEAVFEYSKWHGYIAFASWPVVMAAAFVVSQRRKRS